MRTWKVCAKNEIKITGGNGKEIMRKWKKFAKTGSCYGIACPLCFFAEQRNTCSRFMPVEKSKILKGRYGK